MILLQYSKTTLLPKKLVIHHMRSMTFSLSLNRISHGCNSISHHISCNIFYLLMNAPAKVLDSISAKSSGHKFCLFNTVSSTLNFTLMVIFTVFWDVMVEFSWYFLLCSSIHSLCHFLLFLCSSANHSAIF